MFPKVEDIYVWYAVFLPELFLGLCYNVDICQFCSDKWEPLMDGANERCLDQIPQATFQINQLDGAEHNPNSFPQQKTCRITSKWLNWNIEHLISFLRAVSTTGFQSSSTSKTYISLIIIALQT